MKRVMLRVAYDGTNYVGWQKQPNGTAVEEMLNRALCDLTGENIEVIGASRTDSGVHAMDNVAVFDTESRIPGDKFSFALNQRLPGDIVVQSSCEVDPEFHPRYAKCNKTYEYRIYNAVQPNPLTARYSYFFHAKLDTLAMQRAAQYIVGEHDFASFCASGAQVKTTVRTVYSLDVLTEGNEITIRIRGNGFLYNMVRIIAGTLIQVGTGAFTPEQVKEIVDLCDRTSAGPTAPACGLTLKKIEYEE